jgi:hypothetical protein
MRGVQVLDEDERHAGVGRQKLKQLGECFEPPCRSAHADDGERGAERATEAQCRPPVLGDERSD